MMLFLLKVVLSAGIVIGVTWAAERYGPRLGGIIASVPQLAVVSLLFFGLEQGLEFAAESAFWNIPGVCATLPFFIGYQATADLARGSRRTSMAAGIAGGTASFLLATAGLAALPLGRASVMPFAAAVCGTALWMVRHLPDSAPLRRVRTSALLLATRAGVSAAAVIAVTSVAHLLGPKWSGLAAGFPVNALPVMAILHFHYGLDVIKAVIRAWPVGVFGICLFNLVAWLTVVRVGLLWAIVLAYLADFVYLVLVDVARRGRGKRSIRE